MNIKFLIRDLRIEGVQIVILRLAKLLQHFGHNIEIITLFNRSQLPIDSNLPVIRLNIPEDKIKIRDIAPYFDEWYKSSGEFDFLLAPHSESIKLIEKYNDQRLIPYIHNSDKASFENRSFFKRLKYKYKLRKRLKNKRILCVSNGIKQFIDKCCGNAILSNHVLYNPFNIEEIKALSLEEHKYLEFCDYLLFIGRLEKQKRVDRLLKAFSLIKNKNVKLCIVGEGRLYNELTSLAAELNVAERVIFTDFTKNPYPVIKLAKCLILTSDHEGFGNVLVESLILGTPALSVNCPSGPDEILTGELSRYLINSYDESIIAQHIDKFLEDNEKPDLSIGYNKFTQEVIYQSFMDIVSQWQKG